MEDAEPVILIPMGLPCLERGRLLQKKIDSVSNGSPEKKIGRLLRSVGVAATFSFEINYVKVFSPISSGNLQKNEFTARLIFFLQPSHIGVNLL